MNENHLSEEEKKLFQELARKQQPPAHLEKKIVQQLIQEGQIKKRTSMQVYLKWGASIAASILLFLSGMFYGKTSSSPLAQIELSKGYMLLLHEDAQFNPGDPQKMFEEYEIWMENTFEKGVKITGQELKAEAVIVNHLGQANNFDQNAQKRTTGYFIIEASSLNEAVKVAQENPHIKYGGSIEVKPYMIR